MPPICTGMFRQSLRMALKGCDVDRGVIRSSFEQLLPFFGKQKNKGPLVAGEGDGNIGAHPSNIWVECMVESTQMLLSMDHVPVHGSLNQWAI